MEREKELIMKEKRIKKKKKCKNSILKNPHMNVLISDYHDEPKRDSACDPNDENIKENINEYHNENLYKNIDDLYDKKNSQRQFYTMPVTTIPNDQQAFAEWCYKPPPSGNCKYNGVNCLKYEDVRYHK